MSRAGSYAPDRARSSRILVSLLVLAAVMAIASTARTFSATVDEPAHLAAGMQWLSTGEYTYDLQHPPLGRIAIAAGPYIHGGRTTGSPAIYDEGARILGQGEHFVNTLASARHGVLVFFVLLCLAAWLWARDIAGEGAAVVATFLVVSNPSVLAHAGLATTDLACAATTVLALFTGVHWLRRPTMWGAIAFGLATGLAVGSRLSAIAFVGAPMLALYVMRGLSEKRWSLDVRQIAASAAIALLFLIALYRFHPAPLIDGVMTFLRHGSAGHPTFLLGRASNRGWWYYFPVALLVKTPLPLLLLTVLAVARLRGRGWIAAAPLACAATILLISLGVKVDLGVRLVLPVYPLVAIAAAPAAVDLWRSRKVVWRASVGLLLAASAFIVVVAYPDFLSYFNPLAGSHPEHVLVDSNLDWGQDLYRLRDTLRARGVRDSVRVAYFGTSSLTAAGIPKARVLGLHEHPTGWIAASETYLAGEWVGGAYSWLLGYPPVARIGPSMRLWYFPPTRDSLPR